MTRKILAGSAISKEYLIGGRKETILDQISLEVDQGEFIVISGSSGSGKTTLLCILSGLDRPTSGTVVIDGLDITSLSEERLSPVRNRLTGFVFQAFYLIPSLNALENVMFPAELNNDPEAADKAADLLKRVGLWERRYNFPEQLSGGEQQRVALCRALVNGPRVLFADEPTGNLDSRNSDTIINLLKEFHLERGTTLIMATHSADIAAAADRVIRLHDGRLAGDGEQP